MKNECGVKVCEWARIGIGMVEDNEQRAWCGVVRTRTIPEDKFHSNRSAAPEMEKRRRWERPRGWRWARNVNASASTFVSAGPGSVWNAVSGGEAE